MVTVTSSVPQWMESDFFIVEEVRNGNFSSWEKTQLFPYCCIITMSIGVPISNFFLLSVPWNVSKVWVKPFLQHQHPCEVPDFVTPSKIISQLTLCNVRENTVHRIKIDPCDPLSPSVHTQHLEQEKHELRRRLESREGEWEGHVAELETDVQQLQGELELHQVQLRETDRDKNKAISELSEQNHRLLEQLSRVRSTPCVYVCTGFRCTASGRQANLHLRFH